MRTGNSPYLRMRSLTRRPSSAGVIVTSHIEMRPFRATSTIRCVGGSSSGVSSMPCLPSSSLTVSSFAVACVSVTTKKMISSNTTSIIGVMSSCGFS